MWVIRNKKLNNYFKKRINKEMAHFVLDIDEAKKIKTILECEQIIDSFKHKENYEVVKIEK